MWLCVSLTECLALHWNWLLMGQVVQSTQKQNSRDIWLTVKSNDIVFCLAFPQICEDRITFFKSLLVEIWRWTFLGEWDSERHFGESQGDPRVVPTLQSEIWAHSLHLRCCMYRTACVNSHLWVTLWAGSWEPNDVHHTLSLHVRDRSSLRA